MEEKDKEAVTDEVFGVISGIRESELDLGGHARVTEETLQMCTGCDPDRWEIVRSVLQRGGYAVFVDGDVELTDEGRELGDAINNLVDGAMAKNN
jgi:hypothetical protein